MEGYSVFKRNCKLYFQLTFHMWTHCDNPNAIAILHYRLHFHFRERTVTAKFQMERQSPFATISHVLRVISLSI